MFISKKLREKYNLNHIPVGDFSAARIFAEKLSVGFENPVPASEINAMGLLDEVSHILLQQYEMQNADVMMRAVTQLVDEYGQDELDLGLVRFGEHFSASEEEKLKKETLLEEMLLLTLENENPALGRYKELFDATLLEDTFYGTMLTSLEKFFAREPSFGSRSQPLISILRAPVQSSPNSLKGQLNYIVQEWGEMLGEKIIQQILRGMDYLTEEEIRDGGTGGSDGTAPIPEFFGGDYEEYERFSVDKEWMPQIVLLAKNAYVWLDQLSKQYEREIVRLDQIPDEELDLLAARGFTG